MGNLNKVTYTDHQTVITADNLNAIQDSIIANTSYTTCDTSAGTAAKTAALTNFVLTTGSAVKVKFTNTNTAANPSLNINSTGAKPIMLYGITAVGTTPSESWNDGAVVEFVYDGTNWIISDAVSQNAIEIPANADLNDYTTVGEYFCASSANAQTLSNCPVTASFNMIVSKRSPNYVIQQIETGAALWTRTSSGSGWNGWHPFARADGDTFSGNITVDRANGTTSANGTSSIYLGNTTPTGTAGNSYGRVQIYGKGANYGVLLAQNVTADRELQFPDASGTIALTDDVGFINKGHISIGGALTDIENWVKSNFALNRWVVARVTPTSSGYFGTSSFDIMANCSSANYGWGYVHSDNPKNDGHLYFRLGAGIFDWKIVTMNPLNNDGGVIQLTVTRVNNSFVSADSIARVTAYKKSGFLYCSLNLAVTTGGTFSDFVQIASISGWSAASATYFCVPGQNVGTQTLAGYISQAGGIYIYSYQQVTPQFFRTFVISPSSN